MDFNAFVDPTFNSRDWVNAALASNPQSDKPQAVTSLIAKLQIFYKQINTELNETSNNVVNNLPRAIHDIETIADDASRLKQKMTVLRQEITNVEKNTGVSIASIEKIDKIKAELVNAKQALYEADNWTVLSNDIEAVFESGDIEIISSKLLSMQQSLNALANSSDHEQKKAQLEGLKNRLEALASPLVVEAFTKKMIEESKKYVKIFNDMGRFPLLLKYYSKCQKVNLMHQWQSVDLDSEENIVESFQNYYDHLSLNWQEQLKWCQEVMPDVPAVALLAELYTDLLTTLSSTFAETIEKQLKLVEEPLPWLLQLMTCSKRFANLLRQRISVLNSEKSRLNLAKSIYLPYIPYTSKYGTYQKAEFAKQLSVLLKSDDLMEKVQSLGQMNAKVMAAVEEQRKLCQQLTEGCCLPGFIVAVEWYIRSYLDIYKTCLTGVKANVSDANTFQICIVMLQHLGEYASYVKQIDADCVDTVLNTNLAKGDAFESFSQLLLDEERRSELASLKDSVSESNEPTVLKTCNVTLENVCRDIYQTSFTVVFTPIASQLEIFPSVPSWKSKIMSPDLPDYSYSPQEYITQLGQYLMNLPQLLEPFLALDNPSLNTALSLVGGEFASEETGFIELFLGRITDATSRTYCEQILTLTSLGVTACKQLVTDIVYLDNVLQDLGFSLSEKLANVLLLLKLPPADYASQSAGVPAQLVAAIRQIRNIVSE